MRVPDFPAPSQPIPTRPLCRWYGGKWNLAPWIIEQMPPHRVYVEPFGGAASVLLRKPPSHTEVLGDLDDDLLEVYRTVRDPDLFPMLCFRLMMTPFSRAEFELCYEPTDDVTERVRRFLARQAFAVSTDRRDGGINRTGFRDYTDENRTPPAHDWWRFPDALGAVSVRLRGVIIEQRDAVDTMRRHDGPQSLHYVDPPYRMDTRKDSRRGYNHELTDDDHGPLLAALCELQGMVMLSGYQSEHYDDALPGWQRTERTATDLVGNLRTECLWLNPAAQAAQAAGTVKMPKRKAKPADGRQMALF